MACDCDEGFAGARCERNVGLNDGGNSDADPGIANQCKGEPSILNGSLTRPFAVTLVTKTLVAVTHSGAGHLENHFLPNYVNYRFMPVVVKSYRHYLKPAKMAVRMCVKGDDSEKGFVQVV